MTHANPVDRIRAHWNDRASLGGRAGTNDLPAKRLEIEAIAQHVRAGMTVLDVGCGNGVTAIELARRYPVHVVGMDFAEKMVEEARAAALKEALRGTVDFLVEDLFELKASASFDLAYTERTLINLPDWASQGRAIGWIGGALRSGGRYLMCESCQDGLDTLNDWRRRVGLGPIQPPWHNRYLREAEVASLQWPHLELVSAEDFSSTYYFLSRVVNAWLAAREGVEPDYEAPINQMAALLPPMGSLGQVKLWVWRRRDLQGDHDSDTNPPDR